MKKSVLVIPSTYKLIAPPRRSGGFKCPCIEKTYYKGYSGHSHDRPYVMEVEDVFG